MATDIKKQNPITSPITAPIDIIYPRWLTMVFGSGICQICKTPKGNTHSYYINNHHNVSNKLGFICCGKDECNENMENYIKSVYNSVYESKLWRNILIKIANRTYVKVLRSNGNIENNWKIQLSTYSDTPKNLEKLDKCPLDISFYTAILSVRQFYSFHIPNDIWEYIYNIILESYKPNVHLIIKGGLEKDILVCQEHINPELSLEKLVNIESL